MRGGGKQGKLSTAARGGVRVYLISEMVYNKGKSRLFHGSGMALNCAIKNHKIKG